MTDTEKKIIQLLKEDSRYTVKDIARSINETEENVQKKITELEEVGVIVKYTTIINTEKTGEDYIDALIEVRVTPSKKWIRCYCC